MSETDKEFADRLDAQERLEARGYKRVTCKRCDGAEHFLDINCPRCEGRGYWWQVRKEQPVDRVHLLNWLKERERAAFVMSQEMSLSLDARAQWAEWEQMYRKAHVLLGG